MDTTARPDRRITLSIPAEVADALTVSAFREDRPGKQQAVRYIREGLIRDGYLAPEAPGDRPYRAVAPGSVR